MLENEKWVENLFLPSTTTEGFFALSDGRKQLKCVSSHVESFHKHQHAQDGDLNKDSNFACLVTMILV
jgi:hypothetical protein